MFEIGFWELALIAVIALIVLGPQRLPEAARIAGQWVGRVRVFITNVKDDLNHQLQAEELTELRRLKEELTQTRETLEESARDIVGDLSKGLDFDKQLLASDGAQPQSWAEKKAKSRAKKRVAGKKSRKKSKKSAKSKTRVKKTRVKKK